MISGDPHDCVNWKIEMMNLEMLVCTPSWLWIGGNTQSHATWSQLSGSRTTLHGESKLKLFTAQHANNIDFWSSLYAQIFWCSVICLWVPMPFDLDGSFFPLNIKSLRLACNISRCIYFSYIWYRTEAWARESYFFSQCFCTIRVI